MKSPGYNNDALCPVVLALTPYIHETVHNSLSGAGGRAQGGGSQAGSPGVVMETKLKALVSKLSAIHAQVCWTGRSRCPLYCRMEH